MSGPWNLGSSGISYLPDTFRMASRALAAVPSKFPKALAGGRFRPLEAGVRRAPEGALKTEYFTGLNVKILIISIM